MSNFQISNDITKKPIPFVGSASLFEYTINWINIIVEAINRPSVFLALIVSFFCIACSSSKAQTNELININFLVELKDSLDDDYLLVQLKNENIIKINRINRTKNIYALSLLITKEKSANIFDKLKKDNNILSAKIEDITLQKSEGKSVQMKKIKPITKN